KVTKVTDPFGRYATFEYQNGQLWKITDPVGIVSQFHYTAGTNFIDSLTTPYGTSTFATGQSGTNRWIEMTDPLGGKERVEYQLSTSGISESSVPDGFTSLGLDSANTFYWDKKYHADYCPSSSGTCSYDHSQAKIIHWAKNSNDAVSGIVASEKAPL